MDISFNVKSLGPISQISAHILNFDTAIVLASGAYGWWKARERSLSLVESLSAHKTSLVSTSTFNYNAYREARKLGNVQGLARRHGFLQKFKTGVESTAVTQNAGIDCLRSLATGLLCFYSVELTSEILADIIPYGLLHSDQEDDGFEFTGPLFASLSDWVRAVAEEEDCNNFRQHLVQVASKLCQNLTVAHTAQSNDEDGYNELGLLLGCLRWMVTPQHRHGKLKYPTRSIRVWMTIAVMAQLGFSAVPCLRTVESKEQYDATFFPPYDDDYPDVVLVTSPQGKTDPLCVPHHGSQQLDLRPQLMPILSIPNGIFGKLQRRYSLIDAAELIDTWKVCYRHAKNCVDTPTLSSGGMVHIKAKSRQYEVHRDSHKALLAIWSPHLPRIMRPACDDYLPNTLNGNWSPDVINAFLQRESNGEHVYQEDVEIMRNVYTITAILLGTIYGVCSTVLFAQTRETEDRDPVDEELEVALSPDIIKSNKVQNWAKVLGLALCGVLEQSGWISFMLEIITGITHPKPLDEEPSLGAAGKKLNYSAPQSLYMASQVRITDVVGAQANGIFAISEFVLRPSINANSSLLFHIGIGRILDMPVDRSGYVRTSQWKATEAELLLNRKPELDHLTLNPNLEDYPKLRIDAEPHWQNDPQKICFSVRSSGHLAATLDIIRFLGKLLTSTVECNCGGAQGDISVSVSERWQNVTVGQIVRSGIPGASKSATFIRDNDRILVNVGGNDMCRAFAAGTLTCRKMAVCPDCVACAYKRIRDRNNNLGPGSAVIIIG